MLYRKITAFIALFIFAIVLAAQAQTEKIASIGKVIPDDKALDWVQNFKTKFPDAVANHMLSKESLLTLLSLPDAEGIYFFNGTTDTGLQRLIPITANSLGEYVDALHSMPDQKMINTFQKENPTRTSAQLLGKEIMLKLLSPKNVTSMLFSHAIDDSGQERIVYVALDRNAQWVGDAGDVTLPCPPYCKTGRLTTSIVK